MSSGPPEIFVIKFYLEFLTDQLMPSDIVANAMGFIFA